MPIKVPRVTLNVKQIFIELVAVYVELHEERRDLNVFGFIRSYAGITCRAKEQYVETDS